jgi:hypothetical protein
LPKKNNNIGRPVRIFYHDYNKILHAINININTDTTSQQSFMSCTVYSKFAHNNGFKKRPLFMWSVYVIFFNWQYGSRPRKVFSLFRKRRDHYRWTTRKVICSSQPVCIGKSHYNYIISQTHIIILFCQKQTIAIIITQELVRLSQHLAPITAIPIMNGIEKKYCMYK